MTAKRVESLRQKQAGNKIVRLFHTAPFIDDKWVVGLDRETLKKYLIVKYASSYDAYLPVWKDQDIWWDKSAHDSIKNSILDYSDSWSRKKRDDEKVAMSRELFTRAKITSFQTDSWGEAEDKYIEWCDNEGVKVTRFTLNGKCGDD